MKIPSAELASALATAADLPLTQAALLKAPKSDYMSERQLQFFRARLILARAELLVSAYDMQSRLKDDEAHADPADMASIEEEHSLELRLRDREFKQLRKIDLALERIRDGSYGWCRDTGEPIGLRRLLARPTAELCIEAQERHERVESGMAEPRRA
ncbi:RNA polymerase-binding protein DksA [Bordetella sp. BOR01]|uniref:RNA polymerase-binding protein DksA n=1 Tax=Bordetella sp. BOR01 TaxID=2854779 RepID=UPI001C49274C|nr:RNA polymerase-binding protein DksA [Bordetella sp. BOR01]MBV7481498.1 RNA polymerase-binding protein DksA [Bordetella sp. BOR01]